MTKVDKITLGKRLNIVRKERQLSSNELSEKCGVDPVFIRMIESGSRTPSLSVFIKLCNSLRVSPGYLLADCLETDEDEKFAAMYSRMRDLSPKQAEMVTAMIDTMMDKLEQ